MEEQRTEEKTAPPPRWMKIELMGHATASGRVTEVDAYGTKWMQVETLCPSGHLVSHRTVSPRAVYGFTVAAEETVRAEALADCRDPSHDLYCQACGIRRPGSMRGSCPACGYSYHQKQPRKNEMTPERLSSESSTRVMDMIARAGAEVTPINENLSPRESYWRITEEQRLAAAGWALAFHRARLGEEVTVPERPAFLRDRAEGPASNAEADSSGDDDVPM